jgi:RNA polymerase sigma-70 factor (ECF subfamily)
MSEVEEFRALIGRVRAGDPRAAAELVRQYEPAIRLAVRVRLTAPGLRRLLDSTDVCQSILADFFVRAASGQFELDRPEQLLSLLATMARNKVKNLARHQQMQCRDHRRLQPGLPDDGALADPGPSPSQVVAGAELLQAFRSRLSPAERQLADQRAAGRSWKEIAEAVGGSPDALRMQLSRACDRVGHALGLD